MEVTLPTMVRLDAEILNAEEYVQAFRSLLFASLIRIFLMVCSKGDKHFEPAWA